MQSAIAYYRVSTERQRRSGLGIEAQRAAVARFAETEQITLIGEYVESESGKGADALNARGIRTARGGRWHVSTVQNLLVRAKACH